MRNAITGYGTYYWTTGSNRQSYTGYFENGKIVLVEDEPENGDSQNDTNTGGENGKEG